jgi:cholesterol oxidase
MSESYDAIVVGSGFGGGIAASRLVEAGPHGLRTRAGRRFAPRDFIKRPDQAGELLWHQRFNPGGMYDVRLLPQHRGDHGSGRRGRLARLR